MLRRSSFREATTQQCPEDASPERALGTQVSRVEHDYLTHHVHDPHTMAAVTGPCRAGPQAVRAARILGGYLAGGRLVGGSVAWIGHRCGPGWQFLKMSNHYAAGIVKKGYGQAADGDGSPRSAWPLEGGLWTLTR
jgi:hypothetical protein